MPELPEVQALVDFLGERAVGQVIADIELASITVLKTFDPPPEALVGAPVDRAARFGKFLGLDCDGTWLIWHLARAGWVRWYDEVPERPLRPGKSPIALRVRLSDGAGFDLTEAGTKKSLAAYIVRSPQEVPGIAALGPDPLSEDFDRSAFGELLASRRAQVKGVLRDQSVIAGIGNAYSDEILHVAKLSPFALAANLSDDEVDRLYAAMRTTLASAVEAASGRPAAQLKDAKRAGMRVHGRTGEACPVCGDIVREVSFADSSLQYCATCQTGGKPLADRRTSKFLK
ncbi:Fpg/Nei family DNA glycosylase [Janibacter sp. GXQ6167]|uniref:Fpg/Nei family DNA glycosylase n=1 Tax=Janibacter sp. GXQ6167 TaxID=3240791 RepID=UPI0035243476